MGGYKGGPYIFCNTLKKIKVNKYKAKHIYLTICYLYKVTLEWRHD
jgi:hypothetical protein